MKVCQLKKKTCSHQSQYQLDLWSKYWKSWHSPFNGPPPPAPAAPKIQNKNTDLQAGLKYKCSLLRNTWHLLYLSGWTNCIYPTDNLYLSHPLTDPSHWEDLGRWLCYWWPDSTMRSIIVMLAIITGHNIEIRPGDGSTPLIRPDNQGWPNPEKKTTWLCYNYRVTFFLTGAPLNSLSTNTFTISVKFWNSEPVLMGSGT